MVDILLQRWTATVGEFGFIAAAILFAYAWLMTLYVVVVLVRLVGTASRAMYQSWHLSRRLNQIQRAAYEDPMRAHHVRLRARFDRRAGEGENHAV